MGDTEVKKVKAEIEHLSLSDRKKLFADIDKERKQVSENKNCHCQHENSVQTLQRQFRSGAQKFGNNISGDTFSRVNEFQKGILDIQRNLGNAFNKFGEGTFGRFLGLDSPSSSSKKK